MITKKKTVCTQAQVNTTQQENVLTQEESPRI